MTTPCQVCGAPRSPVAAGQEPAAVCANCGAVLPDPSDAQAEATDEALLELDDGDFVAMDGAVKKDTLTPGSDRADPDWNLPARPGEIPPATGPSDAASAAGGPPSASASGDGSATVSDTSNLPSVPTAQSMPGASADGFAAGAGAERNAAMALDNLPSQTDATSMGDGRSALSGSAATGLAGESSDLPTALRQPPPQEASATESAETPSDLPTRSTAHLQQPESGGSALSDAFEAVVEDEMPLEMPGEMPLEGTAPAPLSGALSSESGPEASRDTPEATSAPAPEVGGAAPLAVPALMDLVGAPGARGDEPSQSGPDAEGAAAAAGNDEAFAPKSAVAGAMTGGVSDLLEPPAAAPARPHGRRNLWLGVSGSIALMVVGVGLAWPHLQAGMEGAAIELEDGAKPSAEAPPTAAEGGNEVARAEAGDSAPGGASENGANAPDREGLSGKGVETADAGAATAGLEGDAQPPPPLSVQNVDVFSFNALQLATQAHAESEASEQSAGRALLLWARFRLAYVYGDTEARSWVLQQAPKAPDAKRHSAMTAAGGVGALLLRDKRKYAGKLSERLARRHPKSSQLAWLAGELTRLRGASARSLSHFGKALALQPGMLDARLSRGQVLLTRQDPAVGAKALVTLATEPSADVDVQVRVASALLEAGQVGALPEVSGGWSSLSQSEAVAPSRRDAFFRLLVRRQLFDGTREWALETAAARVALAPALLEPKLELAWLDPKRQRAKLVAMRDALQSDSDRASVTLALVRMGVLGVAGDLPQAREALDAAQQVGVPATLPQMQMARGLVLEARQESKQARALYADAVRRKVATPEMRARLAQLTPAKRPGGKVVRLSQLARKTPSVWGDLALAREMEAQGNVAGAARLAERILWQMPMLEGDPVGLHLWWLDLRARAGEIEAVLESLEILAQTAPEETRVSDALMRIAKQAGQFEVVLKLAQQRAAAAPNDSALQVAVAAALNDMERYDQAERLLRQLVQAKPEARDATLLYEHGRAMRARDTVTAQQLLRSSLQLEPMAKTHLLLAAIEEGRDRRDEAMGSYRSALALDPSLVLPRLKLASLQLRVGDSEAAVKGLQELLQRAPGHPQAAGLLGDSLRDLGQHKPAIEAYRQGLAGGDQVLLLNKIARLQLHELGQVKQAVATLRRVTKVAPDDAEAYYYLGYALRDVGQTREARRALQQYLKLAPAGEYSAEVSQTLADLGGRGR